MDSSTMTPGKGRPIQPDEDRVQLEWRGKRVQTIGKRLRSEEGLHYSEIKMIEETIDQNLWRDYWFLGKVVEWEETEFREFVVEPEGLRIPLSVFWQVVQRTVQLRKKVEDLLALAPGGQNSEGARKASHARWHPESQNATVNNIDSCIGRPRGTSIRRGLRELTAAVEQGLPGAEELERQVLEEEITVHAALVALGKRSRKIQIVVGDPEQAIRMIRKHFSQDQIAEITEGLRK